MERYQFDSATKAALEKLRVPLAVYQFIDKRVVTILLSDGFCELFGFDDKDEAYYLMDHDMYRDTHPEDRSRAADAAYRFATEGGRYEVVYRILTQNKTDYIIVHSLGEHVYTEEGIRLAYIWYTDECSYTSGGDEKDSELSGAMKKIMREENMIKSGYYDYLTGLPNMSYFFELARESRKSFCESGKTAALLYMDLCGMKYFNRKYGFAEGDNLLRSFADILKLRFGNENCSRFGSDHFCAIADADGIEDVISEIFTSFRVDNGDRSLPVRVGICLDKDGGEDISLECDRAKFACDTMRSSYLSNYRYFDGEMLAKTERRRYFIDNLDKAIEEGWIKVYYQPIIRSANGNVCDEEALVRWIDPVEGMIPPSEFIPVLEEANLIYKLDLHVTDQVIAKMKTQAETNLYVVAHSINLSRADFDACDIVEEIRKRVDASGLSRDRINIEVTESIIGTDFDFMKSQIDRLRSLGFRVWMDDFGSGYSNPEVLQSIRFDVIKYDMHFMKEFEGGGKNKIVLTELIRMAVSLGCDTVCEGVETQEQVDFLRQIGCTMMQGYYFCRAIPYEQILDRYANNRQIGYENPEEADYFASIGKVNLYDLTILSNDDSESFENYFNTVPMAILEINEDRLKLIRYNDSYRAFMNKVKKDCFPFGSWLSYTESCNRVGRTVVNAICECAETGEKMVINTEMPDGSVVHRFCKRIAFNHVTDTRAVAIAVLAITDSGKAPIIYNYIAKALSADFVGIYYVNIKTNDFIEYSSDTTAEELEVERHGTDFFNASRHDARKRLYYEDVEMFRAAFKKEKILNEIEATGVFTLSYRLIINGVPRYVNLKAVRINSDPDHIIIGANNVDTQMRQKKAFERMKQERIAYSRITALSEGFICLYTVDPETDDFIEYSAIKEYHTLNLHTEGSDFFAAARRVATGNAVPEDVEHIKSELTKEKVMSQVKENGIYRIFYRIIFDGRVIPVCLKAALVEEDDGPQLLVGMAKAEKP